MDTNQDTHDRRKLLSRYLAVSGALGLLFFLATAVLAYRTGLSLPAQRAGAAAVFFGLFGVILPVLLLRRGQLQAAVLAAAAAEAMLSPIFAFLAPAFLAPVVITPIIGILMAFSAGGERTRQYMLAIGGGCFAAGLLCRHFSNQVAALPPQVVEILDLSAWFGGFVLIMVLFNGFTSRLARGLAQSEARYRYLSETVNTQLFSMTPEGQVDFVNSEVERYFGVSQQEFMRRGFVDFFHPDDIAGVLQRRQAQVATAGPVDNEARFRRHDGQYRWHLMRAVPVHDADGHLVQWLGSNFDVEELHRARALAEEATRMKSAFLSSMSHEIRTPMNAVIGMTSILLDSPLSREQRDSAEIIRASGEHLLTVINDILDYSKIEAGQLRLEQMPISPRECVESAMDLLAGGAHAKGVELGCLAAPDLPAAVLGDAGRLRQVLVNLLGNAVKFTPSGGQVSVEVRLRARSGDDCELHFEVRDTGIGIAPDVLPRLFQPFVQADASTTREYGGTGLGLSISRRLVELMGGVIAAESTLGQGSNFHFSLRAQALPAPAPPALPPPQLQGRRVLIVDDIEINRRILIHYAEQWGLVPSATENPVEALQWVRAGERFDLALLDFHMPKMDGLELARSLRALRSEHELPILILSSAAQEAQLAGVVSGTLLKPIKASRLMDALQSVLGRSAAVEVARPEVQLSAEHGRQHPLRVLVAEDNAVNQKVARLMLQRLGYVADFAGDGSEALQALERQVYDVVFMDVQMPVMDGLQASREICRRWPAGERPRIVAMTANAGAEDREVCLAAGMDDYLTKPVTPERLVDALRRSPRRSSGDGETDFSADGAARMCESLELSGAVEVVQALLADLPRQRIEIAAALQQDDRSSLLRHAHTLKGLCGMLHSQVLADYCASIEAQIAAGEPLAPLAPRLDLLLRRYETLAVRMQRALEAFAVTTA